MIRASGKPTPLEVFLDVMWNEDNSSEVRFAAAREAAPYVHPKLSSVEARATSKTHEERLEEMRKMLSDES